MCLNPPALQLEPKLDFAFDPTIPLDMFSADPNILMTDAPHAMMPSFDPPDIQFIGLGLMASPPPNEVSRINEPEVFSAASLNSWAASRLLFAMDLIKAAPGSMVQENRTPWSHERLYDDIMPQYLSGEY
jgi:hypothetical protein